MPKINPKALVLVNGKKLRQEREAINLSREVLSGRVGYSNDTLYNLEERIPRRPCKFGTIIAVIEGLNEYRQRRGKPALRVEDVLDRESEMAGAILESISGGQVLDGTLANRLDEALRTTAPGSRRILIQQVIDEATTGTMSPHRVQIISEAYIRIAEFELNYAARQKRLWSAAQTIENEFQAGRDLTASSCLILAKCYASIVWDGFLPNKAWWAGCAQTLKHLSQHIAFVREGQQLDNSLAVPLLLGRSRLMRARAYASKSARVQHLEQAMRSTSLALKFSPDHPAALVELGQVYFAKAHQREDIGWERHLSNAKSTLSKAVYHGYWMASLVLARHLRQTHHPHEALLAFKDFEQRSPLRIDVLKNAFIPAESARLYNYQNPGVARPYIEYAQALLHEAIAAGYAHTRHVVALIELTATISNPKLATIFAAKLSVDPAMNWDSMIASALRYANDGDIEGLRQAFVFGMDDSMNWNALGTFVQEFLQDGDLALKLYDAALRLDPTNHVALLNAARLYDNLGEEDTAARYLNKADAFAPPYFKQFFTQ